MCVCLCVCVCPFYSGCVARARPRCLESAASCILQGAAAVPWTAPPPPPVPQRTGTARSRASASRWRIHSHSRLSLRGEHTLRSCPNSPPNPRFCAFPERGRVSRYLREQRGPLASSVADLRLRALNASVVVKGRALGLGVVWCGVWTST